MAYPTKSLDGQLRDIRASDENPFSVTLINVCLADYLTDQHNRDGELLLGVFVSADSTVGEVLDALTDEFRQIRWELGETRLGFDYESARDAIERLKFDNVDRLDMLFDTSLERIPEGEEDYYEACQAWFLIHWEADASDS